MNCPAFSGAGSSGIAEALRSVDCMAGQATAAAFGRIFGSDGVLTAALTIALTLYVALFAVGLLTGRTSLGLSALTPRMMALGLALTFATSWIAYSQVVWNLLSAGPDWIASSILGTKGSASQVFAERLDALFQAVAEAAKQAAPSVSEAKDGASGGGGATTPAELLSYAAVLLLLGTVGVLVTSRIALAALLCVGPIFLIFSLFSGTRGLFEGWLKAAVMFALVPLFTVLIGVGAVAMLTPVVADLEGGSVDLEQAATVFVAAAVHCALMGISFKLVSALTSGWRMPTGSPRSTTSNGVYTLPPFGPTTATLSAATQNQPVPTNGSQIRDDRVRAVIAAVGRPVEPGQSADQMSRIIHLSGAAGPATFSRSQGSQAAARANDVARSLRRPPSSQAIKETLA